MKIESVYDKDIFVSEKYFESKDLKSEWKTFFIKVGVKQSITTYELVNNSVHSLSEMFGTEYFDIYNSELSKIKSNAGFGYGSHNLVTPFRNISLIENTENDYSFAKLFWKDVILNNHISLSFLTSKPMSWFGIGFGRNSFGTSLNGTYFEWLIENKNLVPTTQKTCLKASEVYSNAIPQIFEIAGKYLPVFDCESAVPSDWQAQFKFIPTIGLNEYLQILSSIWQENSQNEVLQKENQKRIGLIYEKLALMNLHSSEIEMIKEWGQSNKLLAKNGTDFYYPKELSIVTIDGFNAYHLAFAEKQSAEIIELLSLFGVQIIDKVNATISNSKVEISDLKNKLLQTSPLIALVAVEKSKNRKEWENEYKRIKQKLSAIHFFETTEIWLSYGNEDDRQKRSSWAEHDNFYYVGKWYSPRVLDGLVEPLGNFLKIRYAERILTVLLLETFAGGVEYLKEKGFDISLIPDDSLNPKEPEIRVINEGNRQYNQSDEDLGKQGELVVFEKLKQLYIKKYNQSATETETGFKVGSNVEVFWRNINQTTTADHDFKVVELNKEIYLDSKATTYGKNVEKLALYISGNELNLMENADKYLIARVYNATNENASVEFVRLQIDNITS